MIGDKTNGIVRNPKITAI